MGLLSSGGGNLGTTHLGAASVSLVKRGRRECSSSSSRRGFYEHDASRGDVHVGACAITRAAAAGLKRWPEATLGSSMRGWPVWRLSSRRGGKALLHDRALIVADCVSKSGAENALGTINETLKKMAHARDRALRARLARGACLLSSAGSQSDLRKQKPSKLKKRRAKNSLQSMGF